MDKRYTDAGCYMGRKALKKRRGVNKRLTKVTNGVGPERKRDVTRKRWTPQVGRGGPHSNFLGFRGR